MRLSKTLINNLRRLIAGESIPASALQKALADTLLSEGLLSVHAHGSRRTYKAISQVDLGRFLSSTFEEFRDLAAAASIVDSDDISRADLARIAGNSKLMTVRACPGFPVNVYRPLACRLRDRAITIDPPDGTFTFITDWPQFQIPSDALVVGVENMENFRRIRSQQSFFERYLAQIGCAPATPLLFVSRYPQSTDLRGWLQSIPNRYIHFGDFDLAGINIFLTEFQKHLGTRATFLIPDDIATRIADGSASRYNDQFAKYRNLSAPTADLQSLIAIIHHYRRAYDQEGYIPQGDS